MDMEQWARVRRKVLMDGRSKRSVMLEEGLHWETLQNSESPWSFCRGRCPRSPGYETCD